MNRLHYAQVVLLIAAALIYVSGLSYLNQAHTGGVGVIESFYSATQDVDGAKSGPLPSSSQTYLEPLGLSVTEKRAAYVVIGLSFFLLALIIVMALTDRRQSGRHRVQLPLVAVSLLLAITFSAQLFRFGPL